MCGIVGILDLRKHDRIDAHLLKSMADRLNHRGPDEQTLFITTDFGVAFTRLSIVAPGAGSQPFLNESKRLVCVANGEIFNHKELRRNLLSKGHVFSTQSDCEVLLHLYEEQGIGSLDRLNGQYAAVIFDRLSKTLLAARDPFGICPFFYTEVEGLFIFASEIKAILRHPLVHPELDVIGLDQVMTLPGLVSPRTMFKGIYGLPNGHYMKVGPELSTSVREFWDLCYPKTGEITDEYSEREYIEGTLASLQQASSIRLDADVEVGVLVSGGLDSALLGELATRDSDSEPLHTFSVDFPHPELSEGQFQRALVRFLNSMHFECLVNDSDIADHLRRAVYHAESPLKETHHVAALILSQTVHDRGTKAVLAGQGADELLAGYAGYKFDRFRAVHEQPTSNPAEEKLREHLWADGSFRYEKDYSAFARVKAELYSPELKNAMGPWGCLGYPLLNKARLKDRHPVHRRSYIDYKLRLVDHLLGDLSDRMLMAHSVETRYPFLDPDFVELIRVMPPEMKLRDFEEKYVLRKVALGRVPPSIIRREKFGFAAPATPRLLRLDDPYVNHLLSRSNVSTSGYFNPEAVQALQDSYGRAGFELHPPFDEDLLMIVLTTLAWADIFKVSIP